MITSIELLQKYQPEEIGVYIHIPFCKIKCEYCDFFSITINNDTIDTYISALINELGNFFYHKIKIKSIYIGGGTPSLLKPTQIDRIIAHVYKSFGLSNPEITIEVNPDDISEIWIKEIKSIGINRVSIGVQSFSDKDLRYLGRRHDARKAMKACQIISDYFNNWSLDLIFGIPFQTQKIWEENLRTAVNLNPYHISTYNLTFEKGTPLYKNKLNEMADDDLCLELYKYAEIYLNSNAYKHYEISNFSKPGFECVHNLIYWNNKYYLGIGTGAFSFLGNIRCANYFDVEKYIEFPGIKDERDYLSNKEVKLETLVQYFRLTEGIDENIYFQRFSSSIIEDFGPALTNLIKKGLLEYNQGRFKPTPQGFYLNNEIGRELLNCME